MNREQYICFRAFLKIWQQSGLWRKYSFEEFMLEIVEPILKQKEHEQSNG